jgi:hypothetical protein
MDVDFLRDVVVVANVTVSVNIQRLSNTFEGLLTTVGLVSKYFLSYTTGTVGWVLEVGILNGES